MDSVDGPLGRLSRPVEPREQRPYRRLFYTPYWTTFEPPVIDVKAALVGIVDRIVAGLR